MTPPLEEFEPQQPGNPLTVGLLGRITPQYRPWPGASSSDRDKTWFKHRDKTKSRPGLCYTPRKSIERKFLDRIQKLPLHRLNRELRKLAANYSRLDHARRHPVAMNLSTQERLFHALNTTRFLGKLVKFELEQRGVIPEK